MQKLLTVKDVAEHCQVTRRTVGDWIRTKQLRAMKVGRDWRIDPAHLREFLKACEAE